MKTINPLKKMPYAQACVRRYEDGTIVLQSYETDVAYVENGWLTVRGLYSATTRRHIGAFMNEIGSTYQVAKVLYEENLEMNIHTGEVRECQ